MTRKTFLALQMRIEFIRGIGSCFAFGRFMYKKSRCQRKADENQLKKLPKTIFFGETFIKFQIEQRRVAVIEIGSRPSIAISIPLLT